MAEWAVALWLEITHWDRILEWTRKKIVSSEHGWKKASVRTLGCFRTLPSSRLQFLCKTTFIYPLSYRFLVAAAVALYQISTNRSIYSFEYHRSIHIAMSHSSNYTYLRLHTLPTHSTLYRNPENRKRHAYHSPPWAFLF